MTRQLAPAKGATDPDPCNADTNPLGIELQRPHQWRGSFLRRLPFRPANPKSVLVGQLLRRLLATCEASPREPLAGIALAASIGRAPISGNQSFVDARDRSFQSPACFCQFIRI
jgi:hypothetical protein